LEEFKIKTSSSAKALMNPVPLEQWLDAQWLAIHQPILLFGALSIAGIQVILY
jgi:hypothetical protein